MTSLFNTAIASSIALVLFLISYFFISRKLKEFRKEKNRQFQIEKEKKAKEIINKIMSKSAQSKELRKKLF